ncbi:Hypothetical protein MVR_LOCUS257 [uncultured virus]|nr:Hypothetical protein MVR_LOCUS257 [uncultured virus]
MLPSVKSKIKQLHHLDELAYFVLYRKASDNTYTLDTTTKIIDLDRAIEINTPIANGVIINNGMVLPMNSNDSFDDYLFVHLNQVWIANEYLELVPVTTLMQLTEVSKLQVPHGLQVDWVHVICSVESMSDEVYCKKHDGDGIDDDEMIKANIKHVTTIEHINPESNAVVSLEVYHLKHVNKFKPLVTIYNSYPIKPLALDPVLHDVLFNDANVITSHLDKYCVIKFNGQAVAFVNIPVSSNTETNNNDLIMDGFVNTNSQLDNTIASTCNKLTVQVIGNNTSPLANTHPIYDIVIKIK